MSPVKGILAPTSRSNHALNRKFALLAELRAQGIARDPRKCIAMTTGNHGPKKMCDRWAIAGGTVCIKHGGAAPNVKAAAKARLAEMFDPACDELQTVLTQNEHMPSKLGAINTIFNRTIGKPGEQPRQQGTGTVVQIGINFGGKTHTTTLALPEPAINAEVIQDDDDIEFAVPYDDSDDDALTAFTDED